MSTRRTYSFEVLSETEEVRTQDEGTVEASQGVEGSGRNRRRRNRKNKDKHVSISEEVQPQQAMHMSREDSTASIPPFDEGFDREQSFSINGTVNSSCVLPEEPELGQLMIDALRCDNSSCVSFSPLQYFKSEVYGGNSLRITTSVGNDNKRQRVYNTMFHVPWRCELLIDVGFFVCLDSFLSLLTIMPAKMLVASWRCFIRKFERPTADDLSDLGCLVVLVSGVTLLQLTDISIIYHFIRGQGTIKLYVVYNVLEIFDKLCQSFGADVIQVFFNSAEGLANSSKESLAFDLMRFIVDLAIAIVALVVHSFIILAQAITLSAAIISHNNALLALLVSNNFAEIKSNVFKRVSEQNLHKLAYYDTVERFHIMAYILFVLGQNILEEKNPWFWSFALNASLICGCEVLVDVIKHAFLAKFNEIKPSAYSEFLEDLCKQTLRNDSHEIYKALTFVPIAPACVVIRVFSPIYAACIANGPSWLRWIWISILLSATYLVLAFLKILVGLCLQMHAQWYIRRRIRKKELFHID